MTSSTKRRRENNQADDPLSLLVCGRDEETGQALSDRQLRDEVVTMLVAGHETTANMLAWTWYLLSEHPSIERRLQTELATVLEGCVPTFQDLPKLHYNRMVLQESLRLYPPVWFISPRTPLADDEIGGYLIPANSRVVVSPYAMHRHTAYWPGGAHFIGDPD
jgi:cytochrome P450